LLKFLDFARPVLAGSANILGEGGEEENPVSLALEKFALLSTTLGLV
jgi:hypothetical protein